MIYFREGNYTRGTRPSPPEISRTRCILYRHGLTLAPRVKYRAAPCRVPNKPPRPVQPHPHVTMSGRNIASAYTADSSFIRPARQTVELDHNALNLHTTVPSSPTLPTRNRRPRTAPHPSKIGSPRAKIHHCPDCDRSFDRLSVLEQVSNSAAPCFRKFLLRYRLTSLNHSCL